MAMQCEAEEIQVGQAFVVSCAEVIPIQQGLECGTVNSVAHSTGGATCRWGGRRNDLRIGRVQLDGRTKTVEFTVGGSWRCGVQTAGQATGRGL